MEKILITTGGTGGHVIPAKIIEEHLKENYEVYYSTDLRGKKYLLSATNKIKIIDTPKLNLGFSFPLKLIKLVYLIFPTIFFLKKQKIQKVISIGGYMSLPVIIAAKFLKLPIFLFEPNFVLGRGNRFFLNFSKKIICYSDQLFNFPKKFSHKIEIIKPLVSKAFYEFKKPQNINDKFCFLISGGSQGAKIFDNLIKDAIIEISKNFSIKIVQQTSEDNVENLKKFYTSQKIDNKIFSFEENFFNLIGISDLCITRAGATSLAEISFLNKPFIAIPLPTAKDNHQMKNAEYYKEKGCCWILNQKNLDKDKLSNFLIDIINKKSDLIEKKLNLEKINNKTSWNDINQKLKKIINEN